MTDPAEQLAREIRREAKFLPERWRAWLLTELRKEYDAADMERDRQDEINQRMSEAVVILQAVTKHLKLRTTEDRLRLTMREFDAAPSRVRKGWSARRIAEAIRGRWGLAKSVAFTKKRLPVVAERRWELGKVLKRKRREAAFTLSALEAWLATKPEKRTRGAYDKWAKAQNSTGQRPLPGKQAVWARWTPIPWPEILEAVEAGQVPGETEDEVPTEPDQVAEPQAVRSSPRTKPYVLDPALRAQRLRQAREAKGLNLGQVAERAGMDRSHLGKIEKGNRSQPSFETMARLAEVLGLSLEDFATSD